MITPLSGRSAQAVRYLGDAEHRTSEKAHIPCMSRHAACCRGAGGREAQLPLFEARPTRSRHGAEAALEADRERGSAGTQGPVF